MQGRAMAVIVIVQRLNVATRSFGDEVPDELSVDT
jgi:hypothetical protein